MYSYYIRWSYTNGFLFVQRFPLQEETEVHKTKDFGIDDEIECIINVDSKNKAVVKKAFLSRFNL